MRALELLPAWVSRPAFLLSAVVAAFGAGLMGLAPTARRARALWQEVRQQERDLRQARLEMRAISPAQASAEPAPSSPARALDEIARRADETGVVVKSFRSEGIETAAQGPFSRLPVQMEVVSTYDDLGRFLASFPELKEGRASAKTISLIRDPDIVPRLRARIALDIYILAQ